MSSSSKVTGAERRPIWRPATALPVTLLIGALLWRLYRVIDALLVSIRDFDVLPQWDMAKYALDGVRLADALQRGDALGFLVHLNDLSVWPPLLALLETPVFVLAGPGDQPPRLLMLVLFSLAVVCILWAGHALDRRDGLLIGTLAALFLLTSPLHQVFATLVMLETPGTLLLLLCLGTCWRAGPQAADGWWRSTCLLSTALFFCKYNYGLMWLLPLLLGEALQRLGSWSALGNATWARLRRVDWRRPRTLLLLLVAIAVGSIKLSGGWHLETEHFSFRATSIGSPLYVLCLLVLLRAALTPRRSAARISAWWQGLDRRLRVLVCWTALPIAFWMVLPPHLKDFFDFLENRSSGLSVWHAETWLFYPRAVATHYLASPWMAWLVAAAAGALVLRWRTLDWRRRLLVMTLITYALLPILHPYKLPRFLFLTMPLLWLATGEALSDATRWARSRLAAGESGRQLVLGLVALVLGALLLLPGFDRQRVQQEIAQRSVDGALRPVLGEVVDQLITERGTVEGVVLGTWNLFSPPLIEWALRRARPGREVPAWRSFCWRTENQVARLFVAPGEEPPVDQVILLERTLDDALAETHRAETGWLQPATRRLAEDPRWQLSEEMSYPEAGQQLLIYRWSPGDISGRRDRSPLRTSALRLAERRRAPDQRRQLGDPGVVGTLGGELLHPVEDLVEGTGRRRVEALQGDP